MKIARIFIYFEYSSCFYTLSHSRMNVRIYLCKQIWHKRMSEYILKRKIDTNWYKQMSEDIFFDQYICHTFPNFLESCHIFANLSNCQNLPHFCPQFATLWPQFATFWPHFCTEFFHTLVKVYEIFIGQNLFQIRKQNLRQIDTFPPNMANIWRWNVFCTFLYLAISGPIWGAHLTNLVTICSNQNPFLVLPFPQTQLPLKIL